MSKTMKEATKENKNEVADVHGHEMYSTWFGGDLIHFRPCCGATKSVSQDRTEVNHPMKLDLGLHLRTAFYECNKYYRLPTTRRVILNNFFG